MSDVTKLQLEEELFSEFGMFGVTLSTGVLSQCVVLCIRYGIEAEDFVNQCMAFSTQGNSLEVTMEFLDRMEKKELVHTTFTPRKIVSQARKEAPSPAPPPKLVETPSKNNIVPKDPVITKPQVSYGQRADSREILHTFGPPAKLMREGNVEVLVQQKKTIKDHHYMYQVPSQIGRCVMSHAEYLGMEMLDMHNLTKTLDADFHQSCGDVTTYGRIIPEAGFNLVDHGILLESVQKDNFGYTVTLNMDHAGTNALFPGQIVAVRGYHTSSSHLLDVKSMVTGHPADLPAEPPLTTEGLQMVVAAGPFTVQDNLMYEPLSDLLKYVQDYQPHVLILIGPFINDCHENIKDGTFTKTFQEFFEMTIDTIMEQLSNITVIVVPSMNDVHHHPVFPTPPYQIKRKYRDLHLVNDPAMIDLNGLLIGVCSIDTLKDLGTYEVYNGVKRDKPARLASHLLNQRSFYPLYPACDTSPVDFALLEDYGMMDVAPHLLIVPSDLEGFIKQINDTIVINPQRLTSHFSGGSFAHVKVSAGTDHSICSRTSCQIIKI